MEHSKHILNIQILRSIMRGGGSEGGFLLPIIFKFVALLLLLLLYFIFTHLAFFLVFFFVFASASLDGCKQLVININTDTYEGAYRRAYSYPSVYI